MGVLVTVVIITVVVVPLLGLLPSITLPTAEVMIQSNFYSWIRAAMYFLPVGTVTAILSLVFFFGVFRIVVAIVKTFWDILPFTG